MRGSLREPEARARTKGSCRWRWSHWEEEEEREEEWRWEEGKEERCGEELDDGEGWNGGGRGSGGAERSVSRDGTQTRREEVEMTEGIACR